jgi:hypothetical protein
VEATSLSDFLYSVWEATREVEYPRIPTQVFKFAHKAKGRPELANLEALDAADTIETILETWDEADPDDPWSIFDESADGRAEFISVWDKIKYPAGKDILKHATEAAGHAPPLKPIRLYSKKYAQFLGIAAQLQVMRPNIGIKLPVEALGRVLGCDYSLVGKYRKFAEKEQILRKIKDPDRKAKQAAEFIFDLKLFDLETGEQVEDPISPTPTPPHSYERHESHEKHETYETYEDLGDIGDLRMSNEISEKSAFASQSAQASPEDYSWLPAELRQEAEEAQKRLDAQKRQR